MQTATPTVSQKQQFEENKLTKRLRRLARPTIADVGLINVLMLLRENPLCLKRINEPECDDERHDTVACM